MIETRFFRKMMKYWLLAVWAVFGLMSCTEVVKPTVETDSKPNILFIAVDDLNDWVGVLGGHPQARTPHIDKLANRGVLFTNAHAAAPACNPSRVAVMTGLHPSSTGIYYNSQPFRPVLPDVVTLPEYLQNNGYTTLGAGKVYHLPYPDAQSWDEYYPSKENMKPKDPRPDMVPANGIAETGSFDWAPLGVSEDDMSDAKVANWVAQQLQKKHEKPFFLAAGIYRPHLPWYVPEVYFNHYPLGEVQLPPYLETDLSDVPPAGVAMATSAGLHEKIIANKQWHNAVQGYLASIEFADAQVGKIIIALEQSPYANNTIIVLWSDHGWHLGEKNHWRKFALWERSTRVAFMIVVPNSSNPGRSARAVNLIDIYPTVLDLAGLPAKEGLYGQSLRPLLESPTVVWKRPSVTTQGRGNHAVRDDRWRYIRYADGSEELYDHENDPNEWTNLANDGAHLEVIERLKQYLPKTEAAEAPTMRNEQKAE
jgi:arylsulfatase A-like enzyme